MDRDAIFEAWAPLGGRWSPWVKPMLFARAEQLEGRLPPAPSWVREELFAVDAGAADYRSAARAPVAVVVDLERVLAAWHKDGLTLAHVLASSPAPASPLRVRSPGLAATLALWWRDLGLPGDADRGFGGYHPRQGG